MSEFVKLNIKPVPINPTVDKFSDTVFEFLFRDGAGEPVDLAGYKARLQMRPYPRAKRLYDELTTENGRLEIDGSKVIIKFPAAETVKYKFDRAFYDLVVISEGGGQYRIAEGLIELRPEVSRW
jgi:hypothetical protein